MRRTKIKIDSPIVFLDTGGLSIYDRKNTREGIIAYKEIIWFKDDVINVWKYNKETRKIEEGKTNSDVWNEFLSREKMNRFIKISDTDIPSNYKQDIIMELFEMKNEA